MRRLFYIIFTLVFMQMNATEQMGDVITVNGEEWFLRAKPISNDSLLHSRLKKFLPKNTSLVTGNWSGYTAYWKVENNHIYLQRIEVPVYDDVGKKTSDMIYKAEDLQSVFDYYYNDGKILARWLNGEFRVGRGEWVRFLNSGFQSSHATEQVLKIKNGDILETVTYRNYRADGFSLDNIQGKIMDLFPWNKFPEYARTGIIFSIHNPSLTADGFFRDCDIRSIRFSSSDEYIEDNNHPLALAIKGVLRYIYPWEVFHINGRNTLKYESFMLNLNRDHNWLVDALKRKSKYPADLHKDGEECTLLLEYSVDENGYIDRPKIVNSSNKAFNKVTMETFRQMLETPTALKAGKYTIQIQYNLDSSKIDPKTDVLVTGNPYRGELVLME